VEKVYKNLVKEGAWGNLGSPEKKLRKVKGVISNVKKK